MLSHEVWCFVMLCVVNLMGIMSFVVYCESFHESKVLCQDMRDTVSHEIW